jgi:hypothetical protein
MDTTAASTPFVPEEEDICMSYEEKDTRMSYDDVAYL